jgi:hypothetical protein
MRSPQYQATLLRIPSHPPNKGQTLCTPLDLKPTLTMDLGCCLALLQNVLLATTLQLHRRATPAKKETTAQEQLQPLFPVALVLQHWFWVQGCLSNVVSSGASVGLDS